MTLHCMPYNLKLVEEVTYYVNGRPINGSRFNSRYIANCENLRILKVKYPDDNAVFTCNIFNRYGTDIKNATLRVLGECIFIVASSSIESEEV